MLRVAEDLVLEQEEAWRRERLEHLFAGPWVPVPLNELRYKEVKTFWRPTADGLEMPMTWVHDLGSGNWAEV